MNERKQHAVERTIEQLQKEIEREDITNIQDCTASDDSDPFGRTTNSIPVQGISTSEILFIRALPFCYSLTAKEYYCPCGSKNKTWRNELKLSIACGSDCDSGAVKKSEFEPLPLFPSASLARGLDESLNRFGRIYSKIP